MHMPDSRAIGVFDSGVGGLTVAARLMQTLPAEDLIYFGDSARVPYGIRSAGVIREFCREIAGFLLAQNVKMIVVACNTASAVALEELETLLPIPVIGVVEPGSQKAVASTQSSEVAVIGTSSTIQSRAYVRAMEALSPKIRVLSQACPLLVPLVEEGLFDGPVTEAALRHYLEPLLKSEVDTLVLGCTHYPFLQTAIQKFLGDQIQVVDAAQETALLCSKVLKNCDLANHALSQGQHHFYFSDRTDAFQRLAKKILPGFEDDLRLVDVESEHFRKSTLKL
jgi:glutamate racemase